MADLHAVGDLLDVCLARSEGVIDPSAWKTLAETRVRVRRRLGFLGEVLVVALAGGTGSGKSSLLNALCGRQVARVGIERPTTSRCLAVIPSGIEGELDEFIAAFGIDDIVEVDTFDSIVFVDLPDFDSTYTDHRAIVDDVLPLVDAAVWVVDPEKYADRMIHDRFLKPLRRYEDQMVFALNQADRLGDRVGTVVESLHSHLTADGYHDPEVVATVALATETIDPEVAALKEAIERRFDVKRSATVKLCDDVAAAANTAWSRIAKQFDDLTGDERARAALVLASLVSLGVAAAEARATVTRG
jgi:GTPase SAR1 family protein